MSNPVFTTSYMNDAADNFLTSFARLIDPNLAIELGAQQGHSAVNISMGMRVDATFVTYDLFDPQYAQPPHGPTHASMEGVQNNLRRAQPVCDWEVRRGSIEEIIVDYPDGFDLFHLDICNHYENAKPVLEQIAPLVSTAMIIEGGIYNQWQKQCGFKPWHPILDEAWFRKHWKSITIALNDHNAITLATRKRQGD